MKKMISRKKDWGDIRMIALRRDGFECRVCGQQVTKLAVHHLIPFKTSKKDELDNLISLCPKHHRELENQYTRVGKTHYFQNRIDENVRLRKIFLEGRCK